MKLPDDWEPPPGGIDIYPTQRAPIVRRPAEFGSGDDAVPSLEVVPAHFGLLPSFAKDIRYGVRTYNARIETVTDLPSFRTAWSKAQHCIVPASAIYEPDWRSGQCIPTRFTLASDEPMGLAGLWTSWRGPDGQRVDSFCMLTINADEHALFRDMHRPDPKRPPNQQDKRMVVILPAAQFESWLDASPDRSMQFMRPFPADRLVATPEPPGSAIDEQATFDF
ncbi:SOS response-associated peptidase family protein [soil metagenome]